MTDGVVYREKERTAKAPIMDGHAWFISYLLSNVSNGLTSPLIPLFVVIYLHSSVAYVGLTVSIASAASVPALILWGNLSDALEKRKVFLLIGFIGSFVSLLLILIVNSIGMFILTLVIFQFLAMASTPVATLLIIESTVEKRWPNVMASFNTMAYIGLVAGLGVGTLILNLYGSTGRSFLPELYIISAFVYLFAGISAWILLPEPKKKLPRGSAKLDQIYSIRTVERVRYFPSHVIHTISLRKNKTHKFAKRTKIYIFYTSFLMFGFQLFFIPFPVFLLEKLNGTETQIFVMFLLNNVASAIAFKMSGKTINSLGITGSLSMALFSRVGILAFSSILTFAFIGFNYALWIAISCYALMGFFWSFISISWVTSISKLALPENRGRAIGYYNSFLGVGQIGSGVVSGVIAFTLGYTFVFAIATVAVFAGSFMLVRFHKKMSEYIAPETKAPSVPISQ